MKKTHVRALRIVFVVALFMFQIIPSIMLSNINTQADDSDINPKQAGVSDTRFTYDNEGFFVGVDRKLDFEFDVSNDPDNILSVSVNRFEHHSDPKDYVKMWEIENPVNGHHKIDFSPFAFSFYTDTHFQINYQDENGIHELWEGNTVVKTTNLFETYRDNEHSFLYNRSCVYPSVKGRNRHLFNYLSIEHLYQKDRPKDDFKYNVTLVWDQRSQSSETYFGFGITAGFNFDPKDPNPDRFVRIADKQLPSGYQSIICGEDLNYWFSRVAGVYFAFQHTNNSDLVYPLTIKLSYPDWINPKGSDAPPLRLLRFEANTNKWEVMDKDDIVDVTGEPNTVELLIRKQSLYAFGRYSWDYEKEIKALGGYEGGGIPGYPVPMFLFVALISSLMVIMRIRRTQKC